MGSVALAQKGPTVSGTWNYSLSASSITEAGTDFYGTYESASNQLIFNKNKTKNQKPNWVVQVKKSDILWHTNLKMWIRRTGNGSGVQNSSISNGSNYQEVQNSNIQFFDGYEEVNEIPIQLKISGVSVIIPVNSYYTLLIFTVTEN